MLLALEFGFEVGPGLWLGRPSLRLGNCHVILLLMLPTICVLYCWVARVCFWLCEGGNAWLQSSAVTPRRAVAPQRLDRGVAVRSEATSSLPGSLQCLLGCVPARRQMADQGRGWAARQHSDWYFFLGRPTEIALAQPDEAQ